MKTIYALFVAVVSIFATSAAFAEDCSVTIQKSRPYGGMVGTITKVSSKELKEEDDPYLSAGIVYSFTYKYPNGYIGHSWSLSEKGSTWKVSVGQKYFWMPANAEVRKSHPNEDRHVPVIVSKDCALIRVDISGPAAEIEGI